MRFPERDCGRLSSSRPPSRRVPLRFVTLALAGYFLSHAAFSGEIELAGGKPGSPSPEAQEAIDEDTLALEEARLVDETRDESGLQSEKPPEPELPRSTEIEAVDREEAATPRRIRYQVGLSVRAIYDDNINLSSISRENDFYSTIEPTIELGIGQRDGNFVALTYAPQAYLFLNHPENDALQHIISFTGQYRFPLLTLSLIQDVQLLDGTGLTSLTGTGTDFTRTNLDVAGRTRVNIYTTRINANYSFTGKTFLTGGLYYSISDYETLIDSTVLSGNAYFNYTYSPKLAIGLGIVGGYNKVGSPSQDQTFEQINARASYELSGKVSATVSAGIEFRQISGGGPDENGAPVFDGSIFYQPFDGTSLALIFSRRTLSSATLSSQNLYSTSAILSARQRFLQRIYLGLSVGYENSSYFSTVSGIASTREDEYYFLQTSLDFDITRFWTAGIYYFYRENDSSLDTFSFYANQFGLRTALIF